MVTLEEVSTSTSPQFSTEDLETFTAIAETLRGTHRLGVAFSGGVDSAVLLAVAAQALGRHDVLALLGVSPSLAASERAIAHQVADSLGVQVIEFEPGEQNNPLYRANGFDRCYHCKHALFTTISTDIVAQHHLDAVAYGENADDALAIDRPGARAAHEHRILRPLADAGVTKTRVRSLARAFSLSVADKPAAPCLASRIPHGQEVTPEKLRQIEDAEAVLKACGFSDGRVRHHGDIARIEVPLSELPLLGTDSVRQRMLAGIREAGFLHVTVDLAGMQSGLFTLSALRESAHV